MALLNSEIPVKAIHDTDLIRVLKKLGIYEDVIAGKYRCAICGQRITLENLGGIFEDKNGRIKLVCNNVGCLVKATQKSME